MKDGKVIGIGGGTVIFAQKGRTERVPGKVSLDDIRDGTIACKGLEKRVPGKSENDDPPFLFDT